MLQKLFQNKVRLLGIILLLLGLVFIRAFEDVLFYDPLLSYYKQITTEQVYPKMDVTLLSFHLALRYLLNTLISLGILYVLFRDRKLIGFLSSLYTVAFMFLITAFLLVLHYFPDEHMALFYLRRFLIQPLFLLLFIPAYYFQQQKK